MNSHPLEFATPPAVAEVTWENVITPEQWAVYSLVIDRAQLEGVRFALGGGLALGFYTGSLRQSKDLDMYVVPEDREKMMEITRNCGLADYYDQVPYDRNWIYRCHQGDVIVDTIWAMANRRATVDERWIATGPHVFLFGQEFKVIPPEELIWSKLYVLQRDRCDWPDILNLIYATGPTLDWEHLMSRVEEDRPLVKGVLSIFAWVSPSRAAEIPRRVWRQLGLAVPKSRTAEDRKDLLDSRPWLITQPICSTAA